MTTQKQVYIEPLSCAMYGFERERIELGDVVVVAGCGPIGLGTVVGAKRRGPGKVIAVDCLESRLEIARACGADVVLQVGKDVLKRVKEMSGGYGCDVYFEAPENGKSVVQWLQSCRKAATFVDFSMFRGETSVDWTVIGDTKELNIRGSHCSGDRGYQVAIDLLKSGAVPCERIFTHSLPLEEVVSGIKIAGGTHESVKVTIDPTVG